MAAQITKIAEPPTNISPQLINMAAQLNKMTAPPGDSML
jgi:hypothetical protein